MKADLIFAITAIVALVLLVGTITVQILEMNHYMMF